MVEVPIEVFIDRNDENYRHIFEVSAEVNVRTEAINDASGAYLQNTAPRDAEQSREDSTLLRQVSSVVEVPIELIVEVDREV